MNERARRVVVFGLATLSFLAPLKFGQPVILDRLSSWPTNWVEWILTAWPNSLFYVLFIPLVLFGLGVGKWTSAERRIVWLPIPFLLIQVFATLKSVDPRTSHFVLRLFFSLGAGYMLGALAIKTKSDFQWIGTAWVLGCLLVVNEGFNQAMGGLEQIRENLYLNPEYAKDLPELWHKVESNRIFSTFINPNALGGYIAAAIFVVAAWCISMWKGDGGGQKDEGRRANIEDRGQGIEDGGQKTKDGIQEIEGRFSIQNPEFKLNPQSSVLSPRPDWWNVTCLSFAITLILLLLGCLWLSQSKGGYAVLFLSLVACVLLFISRLKAAVVCVVLVCTIALFGFAVGYGKKGFRKGVVTMESRTAYWRAAWRISLEHPVLGAGPGAFSTLYPRYKQPEDENTKLVHNSYLQMACDSGVLGFITFMAWLPGSLALGLYRWGSLPWFDRLVPTLWWCAGLSFALHSLVDFNLYMIGNSWPIFLMLGSLSTPPVANSAGYRTNLLG